MIITAGMQLQRKYASKNASNMLEVVELYPDNKVRVQHLEHGKRQTIVNASTLATNWKIPTAPVSVEQQIADVRSEFEARISSLETRLDGLLAALGGK